MTERFLSRKFIIALLMILSTVILAILGSLTGEVATIFSAVGSLYMLGQSAIDGVKEFKGK
jgi:hypothetical protein